MKKKVAILAGGTGGHVMPALAVAQYLKEKDVAIHWLGTKHGIEASLVPKAGFNISFIDIQGVRGKKWRSWLTAPFRIAKALFQSWWVLWREKPQVVLSMGGYVAGPSALAAWLLRRPLVLHEQNAVAGWTNRVLSQFAARVMVAFPQVFTQHRGLSYTGNPVRKNLIGLPSPESRYQSLLEGQHELKILVLGGSQGAAILNECVPQALSLLSRRPQVWHQTGKQHLESTKANYQQHQVAAKVEDFIEDMAVAYSWADVVICRAGALTVAEIAVVGVASILIPFPYAVDDHQTFNAKYLSDHGAAILLPQPQLNAQSLSQYLLDLSRHPEKCLQLAKACQLLAKPLATALVAENCLEVSCGA